MNGCRDTITPLITRKVHALYAITCKKSAKVIDSLIHYCRIFVLKTSVGFVGVF